MSVHVQGLEKTHRGATAPALRDISMEIQKGQCAAILGRSGAGKSTLLRCLVGLDPFDKGRIQIDGVGVDAAEIGPSAARWQAALTSLRGHIGMVFQSFELFPHLTVAQNCILAPVQVRGVQASAAETRALELLAELGLADKARSYPDQLSGGQKQRVAIARALAMEPAVLLYDEPTSALDPALRSEVRGTLQRIARTGMTQMIVTHDVTLAREAADIVFVIHGGEIVEAGPPSVVLAAPRHEATQRLVGSA
jgi:ABC-type polar amino acid transport system ATPase subunit